MWSSCARKLPTCTPSSCCWRTRPLSRAPVTGVRHLGGLLDAGSAAEGLFKEVS